MAAFLKRAVYALTWVPVGVLVSDTVLTLSYVRGEHMAPTLPAGSVTLISRAVRPSTISRGEVVSLAAPDSRARVLRRVVALPGDYVTPTAGAEKLAAIEKGFVWVEGDAGRTDDPYDSNNCGPLPVALINGRVIMTLPEARGVPPTRNPRVIPATKSYV